MDDDDQFNLFRGEQGKADGISLVAGNDPDWHDEAYDMACLLLPYDAPFPPELIKRLVEPVLGRPKHPNCWGALASALRTNKVIRGIGEYDKSTSIKNHAHKYEWCIRCRSS